MTDSRIWVLGAPDPETPATNRMSEIITRTYTRGYPHPGEIHVHSRDGGQTWEGYRHSEWHGVQSGEYWYGPDALTLSELAEVTRDYQLTVQRLRIINP